MLTLIDFACTAIELLLMLMLKMTFVNDEVSAESALLLVLIPLELRLMRPECTAIELLLVLMLKRLLLMLIVFLLIDV